MDKKEPMTLFGYNKLQAEVKDLKQVKRPQTVKDIEEALEHGDLKENAEYHAAKEQQRIIDGRLAELAELIGNSKIIRKKYSWDKSAEEFWKVIESVCV